MKRRLCVVVLCLTWVAIGYGATADGVEAERMAVLNAGSVLRYRMSHRGHVSTYNICSIWAANCLSSGVCFNRVSSLRSPIPTAA